MAKTFPGLKPTALDPLLPDAAFFAAIRDSQVAHLTFDIATYWTATPPSSAPVDPVVPSLPPSTDTLLLRLVNDRSVTMTVLDIDAGINIRAANNIISYRNGQDKLAGTADDNEFDTIAELDAIPFVGASTLTILRTFAAAHPR